ncbi:NAD-binding Rossmann fold oxidoreductase family protein [Aspergillus sclerotioniger CBS 115572]|uniref:NAD-binding Rossmann fold oxidoreductase family protein n=1 Tax=Aspergillus sclerotioniger CBS 115572 TaxID=1450535 RepID=A0A317WW39_9EURO|nr:NAD-binding Rossmann fold oxidoreductase family protein [Aspergillus sclerotioniger CBS 115572]PWY90265.1 NAD-binding Rossmann fold oxidoreductase family protein [Aspergillus sclerotioniger CBS 115572]
MAIGIAIIGSGNFAREEHLPLLHASTTFNLKALYSRTHASAETLLAEKNIQSLDIYSEDSGPGKQYEDLLAREDVDAVVIALPITAQPTYIKHALLAGKHVLSEKPIAGDLSTARSLLSFYQTEVVEKGEKKVLWGVAENYRFLGKFSRVAEEVRKLGTVRAFRVSVRTLIKVGSKYHQTEWRRTPAYRGGFVLDGGIHVVAGLRLILGKEDALAAVSAMSCLQQEHLAPVDTVDAVVKTKSGATGVVSLSYGAAVNETVFEFSCDGGVVSLNLDRVTANGESFDVPFEGRGVNFELAAFGESIRKGELEERLRPDEAMADLEIMEGMFVSDGGCVQLELQ